MIGSVATILPQRATPHPAVDEAPSPLCEAVRQFGAVATRVYPTADRQLVVVPALPRQSSGLSKEIARYNLKDLLDTEMARQRGLHSLPYLMREALTAGKRPVALNLELRADNQADIQRLPDMVSEAMAWVDFPVERTCLTSSSLSLLKEVQKLAPTAALALMTGGHRQAMAFTPETIRRAQGELGPQLVAVHTETSSLSDEPVDCTVQLGLGLGVWTSKEQNPQTSRMQHLKNTRAVLMAAKRGIRVEMATAFPTQLRAQLRHRYG